MIKKILLGTFCISQFSLAYANEIPVESIHNPLISYVNNFQKVPKTVIIKTKKLKIKIDKQENGKYLYQSWSVNSKLTSKPSMIINSGNLILNRSTGGHYYYEFKKGRYVYQIWRYNQGAGDPVPPYALIINDTSGNQISNEPCIILKN